MASTLSCFQIGLNSPHDDESTHFYFSYGSNMLKERIRINDPDAQPYAAARLEVTSFQFALTQTSAAEMTPKMMFSSS